MDQGAFDALRKQGIIALFQLIDGEEIPSANGTRFAPDKSTNKNTTWIKL